MHRQGVVALYSRAQQPSIHIGPCRAAVTRVNRTALGAGRLRERSYEKGCTCDGHQGRSDQGANGLPKYGGNHLSPSERR